MQLVLGRGSQWWQRRELCCREAENCPVHFTKGKTVHFDWLSAASHAGGTFVKLDTP